MGNNTADTPDVSEADMARIRHQRRAVSRRRPTPVLIRIRELIHELLRNDARCGRFAARATP
jgi:hypothetical protein